MSKHTPGPWFADGGANCKAIFPLEGYLIANINDYDPNWLANAHLISAAPELYEALKGLLERYISLVNSGDAGNWNPKDEDEVIISMAAIAKAEGRNE